MTWACEPFEPTEDTPIPVICKACNLQYGWMAPDCDLDVSLCRKCFEQIEAEKAEATLQ